MKVEDISFEIKHTEGLALFLEKENALKNTVREAFVRLADEIGHTLKDKKNEDLPEEIRDKLNQAQETFYSAASDGTIHSNWLQFRANPEFIIFLRHFYLHALLPAQKIAHSYVTHKDYGPQYVKDHFSKPLKFFSAVQNLANVIFLIESIKIFLDSRNNPDPVLKYFAIAYLGLHLTNAAGTLAQTGQLLQTALKLRTPIPWGHIASGLTFLKAAFNAAAIARGVADPNLTPTEKALVATDAVVDTVSAISSVVATQQWLMAISRASQLGGAAKKGLEVLSHSSRAFVITGIAAPIISTLFMPMEIISIQRLKKYAALLSQEGELYQKTTFRGFDNLSLYYHDKATIDSWSLGIATVLSIVGGIISLAAMTSVIGMPLAVAVGVATSALTIALSAASQAMVDHIGRIRSQDIEQYHRNHPGENYFSQAVDIYYDQLKDQILEMAEAYRQTWALDSVYVVTEVKTSLRIHEIAATLSNTAAPESHYYFEGIEDLLSFQLFYRPKTHALEIRGEGRRAPLFLAPISFFGDDTRQVIKQSFLTRRTCSTMAFRDNFTLSSTGKGDFIVDMTHLVHIHYDKDPKTNKATVRRTLGFAINLGQGNGTVYANAGQIVVKGEADFYNHLSYLNLPKNTKLFVQADKDNPYHYLITKTVADDIVVEEFKEQAFQKLFRKHIVEYRTFTRRKESYTTTDTAAYIHHITGGSAGNVMRGGEGEECFRGGQGDDDIEMGGGNDFILQNIYDELNHDTLSGGEGRNQIHYGNSTLTVSTDADSGSTFSAKTSIDVVIGADGTASVKKFREILGKEERKFVGTDSVNFMQDWRVRCLGKNHFDIAANYYTFQLFGNSENTFLIQGNYNLVITEDSQNELSIQGQNNVFHFGHGNNKVTLTGNGNQLTLGDGGNVINITGDNNQIDLARGQDVIAVSGNGNQLTVSSKANLFAKHKNILLTGGVNTLMQFLNYTTVNIDGGQASTDYTVLDYSAFEGEMQLLDTSIVMEAGTLHADFKNNRVSKHLNLIGEIDEQTQQTLAKIIGQESLQKTDEGKWLIVVEDSVGADAFIGNSLDNTAIGNDRDNLFASPSGNNDYRGGKGNDRYRGGIDSDVFRYAKGDGQDHLIDQGGHDKLILEERSLEGIDQRFNPQEMVLSRQHNDLMIYFTHEEAGGDKIVMQDHFLKPEHAIEELYLNDKSYDIAALVQAAAALPSTSSASSWTCRFDEILPLQMASSL